MIRPRALTNQLIEDARVRVTRFDFEPGAETGWHTHTRSITSSLLSLIAICFWSTLMVRAHHFMSQKERHIAAKKAYSTT